MSNKETIVALKSDEQASLSPGAYEVLTGAVERADPGPLSALRMKLRAAVAGFKWLQDMAPGEYAKMAELLEAPEWMQAAEEANTARSQLAHWKTFAVHAEGEHAAWKKTAGELDDELHKLRAATAEGRTYTQADLMEAVKTERHACSICVWMVLQEALEPGADDKGLDGWMREAEARVKGRLEGRQ